MMDYGCIGEHLPHSFSKEIHEKIGAYPYELKELTPQEVPAFMTRKAFSGINVTIPYKQTVIPFLDVISPEAEAIGAVNTVVNRNGRLYGYNTDFTGMCQLLARMGLEPKGKKILILGSGGTSRTADAVLRALHADEVIKVGRTRKQGVITYEVALRLHTDADLIVNTTPCGMYPDLFAQPIGLDRFTRLTGVLDAVYNPLRTRLVSEALRRNLKAQGGLYMLVAQAVAAFEIFTDEKAPEGKSEQIFTELYSEKQNIVLIGMPGSGKSTVGSLLAQRLGRPFVDTDDLIVQIAGSDIPTIFERQGEAVFRRLEKEVIASVSARSGCIIATGGGAVLDPDNIAALKMNGRVSFLDRPLELLLPTADRPLASTSEAIEQRYRERYSLYCAAADDIIKVETDPSVPAEEILRSHQR